MESAWNFQSLRKSGRDRWAAGVCGGFGAHTPLPSWLWRAMFLTAFLVFGFGILAYILLWALMPAAAAEV